MSNRKISKVGNTRQRVYADPRDITKRKDKAAGRPMGAGVQRQVNDGADSPAGQKSHFEPGYANPCYSTRLRYIISRLLYGLLFALVLPAGLAFWCGQVDPGLPAIQSLRLAVPLLAVGFLLMVTGALALWHRGLGLPMNAFPPRRLVDDGLYGLFPHPIYLGFVLAAAGVSLWTGSAGGLWLGTPLAALLCAALVWGYEKPYLLKTFSRTPQPLLGPPPADRPLSFGRRLGTAMAVLIPWLVAYYAFKRLGTPPDAVLANFAFEEDWPVLAWTYPIYASAYLLVPLSFFLVQAAPDLRRYFWGGWLAIGLTSLIYLTVPYVAPTRLFPVDSFWAGLLARDIAMDAPPVCACPSYHVIWALLAAYFVGRRRSILFKALVWLWAVAVAVSCLTTSFHALIDVFGGLAVAVLAINAPVWWAAVLRQAERLANSWHEKRFWGGRLRILNHASYAALAGGIGFLAAVRLAGADQAGPLFLIGLAVLAGAALWGQWLEGSDKLKRPFGFFGGLFGFGLAMLINALVNGNSWLLAAAALSAAPLLQALGRLRCLVQGCCHGRPVETDSPGLSVTNPHSRVAGLAGLSGRTLYPTQVYSIIGNLVIMVILWRAWSLAAPAALIGGLYLIMAGAARFIEEGWRGEAQTVKRWGLPVYQWLSVIMIGAGFAFSALPSPPVPPAGLFDMAAALPLAGVFAALCGLALGVDCPKSNFRFARLSD